MGNGYENRPVIDFSPFKKGDLVEIIGVNYNHTDSIYYKGNVIGILDDCLVIEPTEIYEDKYTLDPGRVVIMFYQIDEINLIKE